MKVFIACLGTIGDVNPYISVGTALASRGHEVTLLSDAGKKKLIAAAGLGFGEVLSRARWEHAMERAYSSVETNLRALFECLCLPTILPIFRYVRANSEPGNTLLVGVPGAIGVKFAQEKLGLPLVHLYLNPFQARRDAGSAAPEEEHQLRSLFNHLRRMVDLPPLTGPVQEWLLCADSSIAAFPRWYAEAKDNTVDLTYTGFVFSDEVAPSDDPEPLQAFLRRGSRPIVFTTGTAARYGRDFFTAAVEACERLSQRAIILSTSADQLPPCLPETVFHCTYVPLGRLLPLTDVIVHHGGMGTCAQALRAGISQLIRPVAFDQFDNAERVASLGVGSIVGGSRVGAEELATGIRSLQASATVRQRCADFSGSLKGTDSRSTIADLLEAAA